MRRRFAAVVIEHRLVPAVVRLRAGAREAVVDADELHRRPVREFPFQVVAGDKLAEPGMERTDVVILEVHLDERLPVVVAGVKLDVIENVSREIDLLRRERGQVGGDVARPVEQQPLPVLDRRAGEARARLLGEMRRAEELAFQVVGPAMNGADDVLRVALAVEHDRLPVTADVRQELDALRVAHERLRVGTAGKHVVVAGFRHHQFVPDVAGRARKQELSLRIEHARIRVPGRRQLRRGLPQPCGRSEVRHCKTLSPEDQPTQPNNPGA